MEELSEDEQKTILHVSHNMETIRSLCSRCLCSRCQVLEKGRLLFDGGPEEAIAKYYGNVLQMKPGHRGRAELELSVQDL